MERSKHCSLGFILFFLINFAIFCPNKVRAENDTIIHISDTHVAVDSIHVKQNSNLTNWINTMNRMGTGRIGLTVHTGDLSDSVSKAGELPYFFSELNRLTVPKTFIPGNHDYQSSVGINYKSLGYPEYPVYDFGDFRLVGFPYINPDWIRVEQALQDVKGEKRLIILSHQPLIIPTYVTCGGLVCSSPKWAMPTDQAAVLRNLIVKYDIETILSGHVHAFYVMIDKERFFEQMTSSDLGLAGNQSSMVVDNEKLSYENGKISDIPLVVTSPNRYDTQTGMGAIQEDQPVRVKVIGDEQITSVFFSVDNQTPIYMNNVGNNYWQGQYKNGICTGLGCLTKETNHYLKVTVKTISQTGIIKKKEAVRYIRLSGQFPNLKTNIIPEKSLLNPATGISGKFEVKYTLTDDNNDIIESEIFIDGIRKKSWIFSKVNATQQTYLWDTATYPDGQHLIRIKTTDKYGRKTYSDKIYLNVANSSESILPTPTPTVIITPTPTITPILTPTPTTSITPPNSDCVSGTSKNFTANINAGGFIDTYLVQNDLDKNTATAAIIKTADYYPLSRGLIKFDLKEIPINSQILKANLTISTASWDTTTGTPVVYYSRLGKPFDQNTNWLMASSTLKWTGKGASALGTDILEPIQSKSIQWGSNAFELTSIVGQWVSNPSQNFGLRIWEDNNLKVNFYASEDADLNKRPKLEVDYICP